MFQKHLKEFKLGSRNNNLKLKEHREEKNFGNENDTSRAMYNVDMYC